jgi:hypothetical protein
MKTKVMSLNLEVVKISDLPERELVKVDEWVLDCCSNGEFINTNRYLSYHPRSRFSDDSIVVVDQRSRAVKGLVMAACLSTNTNHIVSHPGTTFAGPIFKSNQRVDEIDQVLGLMLGYYESKYRVVEFRLQPTVYASQPTEEISYFLMKRGYRHEYTALTNIINLTSISCTDDIFQLYEPKRRNQVRKCIREYDYSISLDCRLDANIWGSMNANLASKYGTSSTHTFEEISALKGLFPQNIIACEAQRSDGRYGAFALVYKFKNVFHTQYLDLNYELRTEYPNLLLIHNLIEMAIGEGFKWFSFGASTENRGKMLNTGLYNFKKGFGGGRILQSAFVKHSSHDS